MAIFAVIAPSTNNMAGSAVVRNFSRHFHIAEQQYVVAAEGLTAQQVAEKIGINGAAGQFVVFSVAGSFGWHRRDLWEWITLNQV